MAQDRTIHTKHLGETEHRDLDVYYDKGSTNYWNHSPKPKGIYFATSKYKKSDGCKTYSMRPNKPGEGYLLVTALERYSRKQLFILQARVRDHADLIHDLLDAGDVGNMTRLLNGEMSEEGVRGLCHAYAPVPAVRPAAAA
jgi:hypothetical protein